MQGSRDYYRCIAPQFCRQLPAPVVPPVPTYVLLPQVFPRVSGQPVRPHPVGVQQSVPDREEQVVPPAILLLAVLIPPGAIERQHRPCSVIVGFTEQFFRIVACSPVTAPEGIDRLAHLDVQSVIKDRR